MGWRGVRRTDGKGTNPEVSLHAECNDSDKSAVRVQCCFRFSETQGLLGLYKAQDGHLDFHTVPELRNDVFKLNFSVALRPQRPYGLLGTREPRTATSTFTQLLSSGIRRVQCCFTSTETERTIRDGEPRTSTCTFTQLPSSEVMYSSSISVLLSVHGDRKNYYGRGAQDVHLDFHIAHDL